jgi:putative polyhydroxyalkanoate system protein
MSRPIDVCLPHTLGRAEAKRRIAAKTGRLLHYLPPGAEMTSSWAGDRLDLTVHVLGQAVAGWLDVEERQVRVHLDLPMLLGMFGGVIETAIERKAPDLLEDRSKPS